MAALVVAPIVDMCILINEKNNQLVILATSLGDQLDWHHEHLARDKNENNVLSWLGSDLPPHHVGHTIIQLAKRQLVSPHLFGLFD